MIYFVCFSLSLLSLGIRVKGKVQKVFVIIGILIPCVLAAVHVVAGIVISFLVPVVAMKILQVIKLDWLAYPGGLLKNKLRKQA